MKRLFCLCSLLLWVGALWAQDGDATVEPEEPEIVLPEVILNIEDFSVEEVEAGIPGEDALAAPERIIPLPDVEELDIEEPELPVDIGDGRDLMGAERDSGLSAQVVLGAGTLSQLYSQVSLNRIGGEEPRFKLRFLHQMLDGVAGSQGEDAGAGFPTREERLEAGIRFHLGALGLELDGSYQDLERGLQQLGGGFSSHVNRRGELDSSLELPLGERVTVTGRIDTSFATQLLTGIAPQETTELLIEPLAGLEFRRENIRLGLQGSYSYRDLTGGPAEAVQRVGAAAFFGAEFLTDYRFEARGSWTWSSQFGHRFPFHLSLSGTPFATFSFQAAGGYRLIPWSAADLLESFPLPDLAAVSPEDDRGWYTDLALSFTLTQNLSLQAQTLLAWSDALPWPDGTPPSNGLFSVTQSSAVRWNTDFRLRWNLGTLLTLTSGLHTEWLDRAPGAALHTGLVELQGNNPGARWGASSALEFGIGSDDLRPLLSAAGFYNITDTISLQAEIVDILYPIWSDTPLTTRLPDGALYVWEDYRAPGLRGSLRVQINL